MGKKNPDDIPEHKVTPGPGAYSEVRDKYFIGSKMGMDNRKSDFLKASSHGNKPGPGTYKSYSFVEKT